MSQSAHIETVTDDLVNRYNKDGVVCHRGVFSPREMAIFEDAYQVLMDNPTYKQMELQTVGDGLRWIQRGDYPIRRHGARKTLFSPQQ